jgi:hypothetical protein
MAVTVSALALVLSGCSSSPSPSSAVTSTTGTRTRTSAGSPPTLTASLTPWSLAAAVSRPVALALGGQILILGGLAPGDVSTDAVVEVDPASGTTTAPGHLEEAVHDAAGAVLDGTAYVFGGGSFTDLSIVQAWTAGPATVAARLPAPRSDLSAVTVGAKAYVLGGADTTGLQSDILATSDGIHFQVAGHLVQPVRYAAAAVDGQGRIWVMGGELGTGENADTGGATDDIQRFDPATGQTVVVGHLPSPVGHADAVFLGGSIYLAGGRTAGGATAAIWRIDPATGAVAAAGSLPGPRSDSGAVVIGATAYLVGGEVTSPTDPLSSVVRLTLTRP